jgi:hypothetical protein
MSNIKKAPCEFSHYVFIVLSNLKNEMIQLCKCEWSNPLYADRLADIEFPLPLEGVQVPELSRVSWCTDGVAARAMDRHGGYRPLVTPHPAHQLLRIWRNQTMKSITFWFQLANTQQKLHYLMESLVFQRTGSLGIQANTPQKMTWPSSISS